MLLSFIAGIEIRLPIYIYQKKKTALIYKKRKIKSILDYGCAVGGSVVFFKPILKKIYYHGVDTEKNVIEAAKQKFKK